ncbi:NAD-dependent epimerase/dehydratase family protein [Catenuloplanes indicus]|uniref:Nucleoside-diphosphate-sugar epimerase n=1 Tax=Catenuloplanes indicus TaxID=137267 RepID=A0AAE3W985_9ACTN|nr:NAD-dependent epimerase/dehydratase family protein [Catenuloplanes indicus]MDQ0370810.1 nucleoside-diphosphate-sugar epimerase [Catenuloplanes indicus]
MRILVTGATGNVGTAVLRRLSAEPDIEIIGVARRVPALGAGAPYDGVRWHAADLGDPAVVAPLAGWLDGVDAVIHLAWQIQPSHDRERLRRTNVDGTRHVLEAVRRAGVPVLAHASSVGVYGEGPKDRAVDESHPATGIPTSSYSRDKVAAEELLRAADGPRVVLLRPGLIFQHDAGSGIARLFLGPLLPVSLLRFRRVPLIPDHPRLRVQAVHADDVADAYLRAIRADVSGAFNIVADPVLEPAGLAHRFHGRTVPVPLGMLRGLAAATWRARLQPTDAGWLDLAVGVPLLDAGRAASELGWAPRHDAWAALDELVQGMSQHAGTASAALRPSSVTGLLPGHRDPA